jgi:hypothetical protein
VSAERPAHGGDRRSLAFQTRRKRLEDRLDLLIERFGPEDCWPWWGGRDSEGYGRLHVKGRRSVGAHRLVLERKLGRELGPEEVARHRCDHPWCCNPAHLEPGTKADNNRDKVERGRQPRGEQNNAKLTDAQVLEIRQRYAAGETAVALARAFGVSDRLVGGIARGEKWGHLGGPRAEFRKPRRASRLAAESSPNNQNEVSR